MVTELLPWSQYTYVLCFQTAFSVSQKRLGLESLSQLYDVHYFLSGYSLNAVIILHTSSATRHHFQLRRTKIISVAFGCIFAQQVAEAADSSLFLFEDYLLQLFKTKRTADWTNKGCSGSITRFTVSFQYGTVVNAVCALWQASKTVPTDSLVLSRSKILKTTTDSDSSARLTA